MASHTTGVSIVYPTVCSEADQRKHQNSASLAFVGGIHRWPVNSLHNGPVTRKMIPFDDVIMKKRETIGISATIAIASKRERNSDGDPIIEFFINGCTGSCYSTISSEASDEHSVSSKWQHFRISVPSFNAAHALYAQHPESSCYQFKELKKSCICRADIQNKLLQATQNDIGGYTC